MSTSFLYHTCGLTGYRYLRSEYTCGAVEFHIAAGAALLRCPACGSRNVIRRGAKERRFRSLPVGRKAVFLVLAVPRVGCRACGAVQQIALRFADARVSYTRAFERYVLELSRMMTILDVARHLGVGWDLVKAIQKRHLRRRYGKPRLKGLRYLAIDEFSVAKGHRYLTVVLDLESGAIVFVGDGKGGDALEPFFQRLRRSRAKVEAVAIDMSPAYLRAVKEHLPQAAVVFDHFHVVKLLNDRLSAFRRALQAEAGKAGKEVLKGTRWLLLKRPENLLQDDTHDERERLEAALRLNKPLATVYYMKETLRQFWAQPTKAAAGRLLTDWVRQAQASGITMLAQVAKTLGAHRSGLLAFYDHRISTGPLEGVNNKIKTLKRQAYGFRDLAFFKLKIMAIHHAKYALVG